MSKNLQVQVAAGLVCSAAAAYVAYEVLKKLLGKEEWEEVGKVAELYIYPVKSCKGVSVKEIQLDKYGAVDDRRFMVIDKETQRFFSQRQDPNMCKIRATFMGGGSLKLSAPGMDDYVLKPRLQPPSGQGLTAAGIWDDDVEGVDQGDGVAAWLSTFMSRDLRLLGVTPDFNRPTDPRFTPRSSLAQTAFSDGFPLLLISNESLADLNARLPPSSPPLPMDRFRPNIVLAGAPRPFAEDTWRRITIGDQVMEVVKPCSRCKIPTTDQNSAERGEQPTATLAQYRRRDHVRAPCGDKVDVFFGQNVCHFAQGGTVRVNDKVYAMRMRYPWSPK